MRLMVGAGGSAPFGPRPCPLQDLASEVAARLSGREPGDLVSATAAAAALQAEGEVTR